MLASIDLRSQHGRLVSARFSASVRKGVQGSCNRAASQAAGRAYRIVLQRSRPRRGEKEGSKGLPGQNFSKGLLSLLPRHGVHRVPPASTTCSASSCSASSSRPAVRVVVHCRAVCRSPLALAWLRLLFCVRAGGGGRDIGIRAAQAAPPSGTHAAGCDLAGHQVIVSALAGLCFALACVDHVLSWCALLMCRSCVCLPSGLRIDRLSC